MGNEKSGMAYLPVFLTAFLAALGSSLYLDGHFNKMSLQSK
jgi:hypothetical protein